MSSSSPPSHAYPSTSTSTSTSTTHQPKFTPEMQDRQARNKDPWTGKAPPAFGSMSDDEDDEVPERGGAAGGGGGGSSSASMRTTAANAGGGGGRTHAHGQSQHHPAPRKVVTSAADAYESAQKRRLAATVLNTPELLQFHALSRNDSIPATRQHFTAMLCGYDIEPSGGSATGPGAATAAGTSTGTAAGVGSTTTTAGSKNKKEKGKEKAGMPISEVVYKPFTGAFEL